MQCQTVGLPKNSFSWSADFAASCRTLADPSLAAASLLADSDCDIPWPGVHSKRSMLVVHAIASGVDAACCCVKFMLTRASNCKADFITHLAPSKLNMSARTPARSTCKWGNVLMFAHATLLSSRSASTTPKVVACVDACSIHSIKQKSNKTTKGGCRVSRAIQSGHSVVPFSCAI